MYNTIHHSNNCWRSCGVLQGCVLGPLLFVLYTTPSVLSSPPSFLTITFMLMTLNSSLQLFHPTSAQTLLTFQMLFSISLPGWLQIFLTLNLSKTEFLLILAKYTTPHLSPLTILSILASSVMNISLFLIKFRLSKVCVIFVFVNFAVSSLTSNTLIPQLPVPLPQSMFTSNLFYCNSLVFTTSSISLKWPTPTDSELSCTCCC